MEVKGDSLTYRPIAGYRIGEQIGGGGFSKYVADLALILLPTSLYSLVLLSLVSSPPPTISCLSLSSSLFYPLAAPSFSSCTAEADTRVFRAVNDAKGRVAACKVVKTFASGSAKELEKEVVVCAGQETS